MTKTTANSRRGQAMVEYVLAFVALLGVIAAFTHLVRAARKNAERNSTFIHSDYP